ncbi:PLP-dependent aspartate aminotransferase family protein [Balneola sp. MJW-20]|uniref:trans-sulfuration enzyme family protein n=1 Tax=Gracilimonas aurantiaca TaxID=3234185 RepID=UPI0034659476
MNKKKNLETIAIHAGMEHGGDNASIVPPLESSTIYEHSVQGSREGDLKYTRMQNPNRRQLESVLAQLENGEAAAAFSSGVAAITSVLQSLGRGSEVLLPEDVYHGTRVLIHEFADSWGLDAKFIDQTDPEIIQDAITDRTRLIMVETPSNPQMRITSIKETVRIAHANDVLVAVDNTWPTPYNMKPLEMGADLVIQSTTKYLGGHSDILGGAVIARKEAGIFSRIRDIQTKQGAVPSPRDCWLLCRSIRSFPYRMRGHNENAVKVASFLDDHIKIEKVYFPGLKAHPGHNIAKEEMSGFGGMISFLIRGGKEEALKAVAGTKLVRRATSLGGIESTWEHRRSSEGEGSPTPENLIRMSVGLEHPDDIIDDLKQALDQ